MRPDETTIKNLDSSLMGNAENAVADFEKWLGAHEVPQALTNMLFAAYVAGLVNTMLPDSNWNTKFKAEP